MHELYDKIRELSDVARLSKHQQIVQGVLSSIEERVVSRGQRLPSINQLSGELGYARKTIDKAYGDLKSRGLIESRNRRGYFVSTETVELQTRVAVVLYAFRPFQETFYNVFRHAVGEKVQVDAFFHHNNLSVLEDIITKISGDYGLYVVAPIVHERVPKLLERLQSGRLLLIDRYLSGQARWPAVVQRFADPTYEVLRQLRERIVRYERVELFYRAGSDHPPGIHRAVVRFTREQDLPLRVYAHYRPGSVRKGTLYLIIGDSDLWLLLEDCIEQGLTPGTDVGILSHNESRIKKLVGGGISTWSTDFAQMAELAAKWVHERPQDQITVPTVHHDRGSV